MPAALSLSTWWWVKFTRTSSQVNCGMFFDSGASFISTKA